MPLCARTPVRPMTDLFRLKQNQLIERFSVNSNELAKKQGELKDLKKTLASEEKKLNVAKDKLRRSKDVAHNCTADEITDLPILALLDR